MDRAITYEIAAEHRRTVVDHNAAGLLRRWLEAGRGITLWIDRELTPNSAGNQLTPGDVQAPHWRFGFAAFHIDDIVVCGRGAELAQRPGTAAHKWRDVVSRNGQDVVIVYDSDRDVDVAYAAVFTPLSRYLAQE